MSQGRREELAHDALAEIDWDEGFAPTVWSGLTNAGTYGDRSFQFFAYSYSRAFEVLWDNAWATRSLIVQYPMLYACRHSIELWLKAAISAVSEGDPPLGHGLAALWKELMDAFYGCPTESVEDVFATQIWPVVSAIDEHDGSGDRLRYPSNKGFEEYPTTDADLDNLFRAHCLITAYCDAVCTHVEVEPLRR